MFIRFSNLDFFSVASWQSSLTVMFWTGSDWISNNTFGIYGKPIIDQTWNTCNPLVETWCVCYQIQLKFKWIHNSRICVWPQIFEVFAKVAITVFYFGQKIICKVSHQTEDRIFLCFSCTEKQSHFQVILKKIFPRFGEECDSNILKP